MAAAYITSSIAIHIMKLMGSCEREKMFATPVKVMTRTAAVTRKVEKMSSLEEKLVTKGILLVLIIWMMRVWDMMPKANHPVWKESAWALLLNPMTNHRTRKQRISSREEIDPKMNI